MDTKWITKQASGRDIGILASETGLPRSLCSILAARGFDDSQSIADYLNPRMSALSDPFTMPGVKKSAERVAAAIRSKQKILIYGDYDVDGVTATTLMYRVLSRCGAEVRYFVPDRFADGYGLSEESLLKALEGLHTDLVITVDCGTSSFDAVRKATELGIDVIVTDHHKPSEKQAPAYALINPSFHDDVNTVSLSGVGVAFKLCHGLIKVARANGDAFAGVDLKDYFDLVALGTVADVVEISGENRVYVKYGLERLSATSNIGLNALMQSAKVEAARISSYHIGFVLGPRINAAGRMGKADLAIKLLLSDDPKEASEIAKKLEEMNIERRSVEEKITKGIHAGIEENIAELGASIVAAGDDWHEGVLGIVASRLTGRYYRPSAVISCTADECKGSCRSIDEVDIFEVLKGCGDLLLDYGGHRQAGGFSIKRGLISEFKARFEDGCAKQMTGKPAKSINIDAWIQLSEIDDELYEALCRMEPFGQGNEEPVFAVKGVALNGPPRILKEAHVKMSISSGRRCIDAIAFNMAYKKVPDGPIDIAFTLDENEYNGRTTLQLLVKDFRASSL